MDTVSKLRKGGERQAGVSERQAGRCVWERRGCAGVRLEVTRQPFAARDAVHRGEHLVGVWGEPVSLLRGDAHMGNEGGFGVGWSNKES